MITIRYIEPIRRTATTSQDWSLRPVLELAILGLLKEQDLHGYELKKRLTETTGVFASVSFGSLYPALARLQAAGAVKAVEANTSAAILAAASVPVTGSLGAELAALRARRAIAKSMPSASTGRGRKVYGLTDIGEQLFADLLAASESNGEDDRSFGLRLAFARYLPADLRLGLLERRRAQLVERLARTRTTMRAGRERIDAYTRSLMEHGTETTERDISWLDGLIAAERVHVTSQHNFPSHPPSSVKHHSPSHQ